VKSEEHEVQALACFFMVFMTAKGRLKPELHALHSLFFLKRFYK
jgi:hypothetical protein